MLAARVVLGVGEASYAILAPGIIGDLFARSRRNRMLTVFYLAIPRSGQHRLRCWAASSNAHFGWRTAFQAVGLPGLVFALVALVLPEPQAGQDGVGRGGADAGAVPTPPLRRRVTWRPGRNRLLRTRYTLGMAMMSFALGGLASLGARSTCRPVPTIRP